MKRTPTDIRNLYAASRRRGLSLLETALVLAVLGLLLVFFVTMSANESERINAKATADKLQTVAEGAKGYMTANYRELLATAPTVGNGALVVVAGRESAADDAPDGSIQEEGFLPSGFIDKNGFDQRTALLVRKVVSGGREYLEGLVTTYGGRTIPDRMLGKVASAIGPAGGFVPEEYVQSVDDGNVVGVGGGWRTPIAQWGPAGTRPSAGSVQVSLNFDRGDVLKDYLYRHDTGNPEANAMNTNIDMRTNSVNNVTRLTGVNDPVMGGDTVIIGAAGDEATLRATIDVWADRDLRADRNVEARVDVKAGNNVEATNDLIAGRNVSAQGDVSAQGTVSGLNVVAEDQLSGNRLTIADTAEIGGDAEVKGKLKTAFLNSETVLYDGRFGDEGKEFGNGDVVTLGDMLPRMVAQNSYTIVDGTAAQRFVNKPNCKGGPSRARIFAYKQVDASQVTPNIQLDVQTAYLSEGQTAVGGVAVNNNRTWVRLASGVFAQDNGLSWTINWTGDDKNPTVQRQVLAQTFCWYN